MEKLYTIDEVAEYVSVTRNTVESWIRRGSLTAVRIGGTVRVRQSDLEDALELVPSRSER